MTQTAVIYCQQREQMFALGGDIITDREKKFADACIKGVSATSAYMEAFETQNKKSAATKAAILKKTPEVREYIEERSGKSKPDKQKVLELLAAIAFTSPADFATITAEGEKQKIVWRIENLSDDVKRAIAVIKNTPSGISIETLDRMKAIDMLMKYMGIGENEDGGVIFEGEEKLEE